MDTAKLTDYGSSSSSSAKTNLEQLQQTLTQLDSVTSGLYQGAHTSTITTDSVVSCVSSTLTAKQLCNNNNHNNNNNNSNNHLTLQHTTTTERKKCQEQDALMDAMNALPVHGQKSPCCVTSAPTSPGMNASIVGIGGIGGTGAALVSTNELTRDSWYAAAAHHHHHHHHHQPLADELVMYTPAPAASISKFGLDTSTEGYLNARYNVNVKGVRHERTSSFFDIPAVTHPYCYRFAPTPPAGILKKSDEETGYCNNASPTTAGLQLGHHHHHHFHNTKVEHADSTTATTTSTTQLSHHAHHHYAHAHAHAHHHHAGNLQHHHAHHPHHPHPHPHPHHHHHHHHPQSLPHAAHLPSTHSSAFKFSHAGVIATSGVYTAAATAGIYHHQQQQQQQQQPNGIVGGNGELTLAAATQVAGNSSSNSSETDLKYDTSPYNSTISSTYPGLRGSVPVDSTTAAAAVTSSDGDLRIDQFYASNAISTSQTTTNQRRGSLQLWQFLVALLDEPTTSSSCIAWTGRGMEFKLIEPEEVARRWGIQKNRPAMNYDKLSRSLRYYYEKGIMQKVNGERYVYRFVCDPDALFNMAYGHLSTSHAKNEHTHILSTLVKSNAVEALNRTTASGNGSLIGTCVTSTLDSQNGGNKGGTPDFYSASLHKFP